MKSKYSTIDIIVAVQELQRLIGMRVNNVYDMDNKTYLFRLARQEEKAVLLMESGSRIHSTEFEWSKNPAPSGFTMKLRKHIDNRRLEKLEQLGIDRIIDMQFGSGEAAYHVILELYDRGNIVLTDYEYTILNVLRPRTEGEDVKFIVKEKYPVSNARMYEPVTSESLKEIVNNFKSGDSLKKALNPRLSFGPALLEHVLCEAGFADNCKIGKEFTAEKDFDRLLGAVQAADNIMKNSQDVFVKGYIIQKREKRGKQDVGEDFLAYSEFHPYLFKQHQTMPYIELTSFNKAVDEFYSKLESQKLELKAIQQERDALKKLENVKKDHVQRLQHLQKAQDEDRWKAQLIEMNLNLVEKAILVVRTAVANQLAWKEIWELIQEAQAQGDPVARAVKGLKLESNHFTIILSDPFAGRIDASSDSEDDESIDRSKPVLIDIDLDLTSYANAKKYYDMKRQAAKKEQKTVESTAKAFKSAEKKTKQTLKDVQTVTSINRARKTHWFEKFLWFISSENYLVLGGRDQQQNELLVKRYLRQGDVYVHADLHGASSIIIKNHAGGEIPPKTLNEAGVMALCYSAAWEAKVVTSAWWVHSHQVSKTAPTGEYLTTGSFMIRGKKNFLPPCHLVMGFGFMFKLDSESISAHIGERKVVTAEDDMVSVTDSVATMNTEDEVEIQVDNSDDDGGEDNDTQDQNLPSVSETAEGDEHNELVGEGDVQNSSDEETIDKESQDGIEEDSKEDGDGLPEFPDTELKLEYIAGDRFQARPQSTRAPQENETEKQKKPVQGKKGMQEGKTQKKNQKNKKSENNERENVPEDKKNQLKRGQKYKLKKMKEKYKDQDDDDRQLAMQILQSGKEGKAKKKKEEEKKSKGKSRGPKVPQPQAIILTEDDVPASLKDQGHVAPALEENQDSDDEKDNQQALEDAQMLDSLTGIPTIEDVLLYAIPVCAPYSTILSFKYKIKMTPGSGKRGKACKTALHMFTQDRSATQREKDLFKSVKDQDLARNLPGKVKLSAPQLKKLKKR